MRATIVPLDRCRRLLGSSTLATSHPILSLSTTMAPADATDAADRLVKSAPKGFVLSNAVTHKRFIPTTHHFVYRTVSLLLSLDDLEQRRLDVASGWLFGYGSRANLWGIRHQAYLAEPTTPFSPSPAPLPTIRQRLEAVLRQRSWNPDDIGDVWLATMPSFLGFEGINPLTVYYVYRKKTDDRVSSLWLVVLEVRSVARRSRPGHADKQGVRFGCRFTTHLAKSTSIFWKPGSQRKSPIAQGECWIYHDPATR